MSVGSSCGGSFVSSVGFWAGKRREMLGFLEMAFFFDDLVGSTDSSESAAGASDISRSWSFA